MKQYIDALNKYIEEQGGDAGEPEGKSLLELLYYCFCIHNDLHTEEIRKLIQGMDDILKKLSLDDNDTLFDITCNLCEKYQREAFRTGLMVGYRLYKELAEITVGDDALGVLHIPHT